MHVLEAMIMTYVFSRNKFAALDYFLSLLDSKLEKK